MITPADIVKLDTRSISLIQLERQIDSSIQSYHGWYPYEYASIHDEYPIHVRNEIAVRYKNAGWKYVYHQTSSENGERPGLTSFIFSMKSLSKKDVSHWHKV